MINPAMGYEETQLVAKGWVRPGIKFLLVLHGAWGSVSAEALGIIGTPGYVGGEHLWVWIWDGGTHSRSGFRRLSHHMFPEQMLVTECSLQQKASLQDGGDGRAMKWEKNGQDWVSCSSSEM